jgi:hypothetical protein
MFATLLLGNGGLLAAWEQRLVTVWRSAFTGVGLAGGVELATPVEKATAGVSRVKTDHALRRPR